MNGNIIINDFDLFYEVIKSATKLFESIKMTVNENGLSIFGSAKERIARCELISNSITSNTELSFSILKTSIFLKVIQTIKELHKDDYSDLNFIVDLPFIHFKSKKIKTKLLTCDENVIKDWLTTQMNYDNIHPEFEFTTSSDLIKKINNHSYIFEDADTLRIYLETNNDDMENNAVYATIGNKQASLNNEMTLKIGLVTLNTNKQKKQIILDLNRLNLFNSIQSNQIILYKPQEFNALIGDIQQIGKNNSYFKLKICCTTLKN